MANFEIDTINNSQKWEPRGYRLETVILPCGFEPGYWVYSNLALAQIDSQMNKHVQDVYIPMRS